MRNTAPNISARRPLPLRFSEPPARRQCSMVQLNRRRFLLFRKRPNCSENDRKKPFRHRAFRHLPPVPRRPNALRRQRSQVRILSGAPTLSMSCIKSRSCGFHLDHPWGTPGMINTERCPSLYWQSLTALSGRFLGSSSTGWLFSSLVAAVNSPEIDFGPASISATNPIGFIVIPHGSPQSSKKTSCGPHPLPSRYLTIR